VKNPGKVVNRTFALFATSLAIWGIVNYISLHPVLFEQLFWIRFVMTVVAIMCLFMLLLINVFPTGTAYFRNLSKFTVPSAIVVVIVTLSPWLFTKLDYIGGQPQPEPGPGMVLFVPYIVTTLGLSLIILFRKFLHLSGMAREYVRYALIGIVSTFSLLFIMNFVIVLLFKNSSFVAISPIFSLIFTTSFAYGMIRHQLFDIRLFVARFVAYLLLILFAGTLYGSVAVAFSFFVAGVQPSFTQIALSTSVVGVMILFAQPLRQFFNRITRAVFYQDAYDTKNVLDKISSVLVRSTDTDALATDSMTILKNALKPDHITMLLFDRTAPDERRLISVGGTKHDFSHITERTLRSIARIFVVDALDDKSDSLHRKMLDANVSIIARLETRSGIIGYCFYGYKASGSSYTKRDIDLIRIVNDELAIAVQNALRFEEIQGFNDTLQQRIEDATKELRHSNAQLQKLDEAKDEFVSMASHQLRTPLTSVKGYLSMVLEGDVGKITATQRQLLSEAFTSSERMVHLINDFLNVSRIQTGKFMLEQRGVNLAKIIGQEVDSLQTTAAAHALRLQYRMPSHFPILYIDEGKIRQVVMNFVDNAIYYSRENSIITVSLEVEDGDALLKVHDTGIGVPLAEQAHLFTKFFRAANARKQRPDGTGVGLFLSKKVIAAHGGSMVFESVEGEGSTFGFRLPVKKLSTAPSEKADELEK
jgi:signal transduction histidine kinase